MRPTVKPLATPDVTALQDNGRRGEPLPGCDCMRCFGYCMVDREVARRERAAVAALDADAETC